MTSPAKQGPARSFCMYEEANGNPELMETLGSGRRLYGQWFSEEHSRGYTRVIFLSAVNFNPLTASLLLCHVPFTVLEIGMCKTFGRDLWG